MQCTNHLKQIGTAVHEFHNAYNGLPPSVITQNRQSFFGILWPHVEQQALYDLFAAANNNKGFGSNPFDSGFADILAKHGENTLLTFGSVPVYRCPSRRGNEPLFKRTMDDPTDNNEACGPQGDYVIIVAKDDQFRYFNTSNIGEQESPFRCSIVTYNAQTEYNDWKCRDTFAWWQDGSTNQLILAEKHIPITRLGRCSNKWLGPEDNTGAENNNMVDCSYLVTNGGAKETLLGRCANKNVPIARPNEDNPNNNQYAAFHFAFGSYHPGVCNFVLGDGSVRSFPTTTAKSVLLALSSVRDGEAVTLP